MGQAQGGQARGLYIALQCLAGLGRQCSEEHRGAKWKTIKIKQTFQATLWTKDPLVLFCLVKLSLINCIILTLKLFFEVIDILK